MGEMRYRQLGDSALTVSVVGLGCNNFGSRIDADRATTHEQVRANVAAGDWQPTPDELAALDELTRS